MSAKVGCWLDNGWEQDVHKIVLNFVEHIKLRCQTPSMERVRVLCVVFPAISNIQLNLCFIMLITDRNHKKTKLAN